MILKLSRTGFYLQLKLVLECNMADTNAEYEDEDDCGFSDFTRFPIGNYPPTCKGQLAFWHGPQGNVQSGTRRTVVNPGIYKNTRRAFRRREIIRAEVWGNCAWKIYSSKKFKGSRMRLEPGFKSHLDFTPESLSQRD